MSILASIFSATIDPATPVIAELSNRYAKSVRGFSQSCMKISDATAMISDIAVSISITVIKFCVLYPNILLR